jgi:predicted DNA-binding transcriptional regulator AlpA
MQDDREPDVIVRLPAVEQFAGKKRSQIFDDVKLGLFPRPIKLTDGGRAIGWLRRELFEWQRSRVAARDKMIAEDTALKPQPKKKAVRR